MTTSQSEMNLYNFEDDEFAESRYVLTSPRSLHACDMLGVEPAELLYKPLSEFQDELLSSGLPLRAIYDRYDVYEKARQRRLRECRDYRDKMIKDRIHSLMSPIPHHSASHQSLPFEDAGYRSDESQSSSYLSHKNRLQTSILADAKKSQSIAGLQRQRTAKVIHDSLASCSGARSPARCDSPVRCRSPTASRPHSALAMTSPSYKRSMSPRPRSATLSRSISFSTTESAPRRAKANLSTNASGGYSLRDLYKQPAKRKANTYARTRSARTTRTSSRFEDDYNDMTDQLSKSLCLSDLSTWQPTDLHGIHLRNQSLRRSLGYKNTSGRVTHRDEKILEALHSKNEQEVEQELSRSMAQIEWEEERRRLLHQKDLSENKRRQLLAQSIADAEEKQALLKERQYRDQEELKRSMMNKCEEHDTKWELSSRRQQYRKNLALTEKRRRSLERKLSQERLLSDFERQRDNELEKHQHKTEYQQMRASAKKENKYYSDRLKKRRENEQEMEQHCRRLEELKRMSKKFNQDLRASLSEKDAKTFLNQATVTKSRDYNLHVNAKERQQRFYKSKLNQKKMEEELSDWYKSLNARRRVLESKAKLTASQTVELKALNAQAEREERESKQRRSYSRLQEEAEMSRRDQNDAIKYKDTKMKLVQSHRDVVIDKVRTLAATSQRMREQLRRKYGKDSFDKVALETELQNKIGRGPLSAAKNKSTVILA